jgi:PAS domain-containing protein
MLNLQKRLHISFAIALALVLITGATSLYYIHQFDLKVHDTLIKDIELVQSGEALKAALIKAKSSYLTYIKSPSDSTAQEDMLDSFDKLMEEVELSNSKSVIEESAKIHKEILDDGKNLKAVMEAEVVKKGSEESFSEVVGGFFRKTNSRLETIQRYRREAMLGHGSIIDRLFARAQQNQILIIVVVVVGGLFLAFFMPRRAVWPFRRILRAFHEVWECKLSVRLPVRGGDELAELSQGFNRMMAQLEELDEMKVKRIAFERRRFEVMANSLDMGVILASVEGKILFVNTPAFRAFNIRSSQVINKGVEAAVLPDWVKAFFQEALLTKQRVEAREWEGQLKTSEGKEVTMKLYVDMMPVRTHAGDLVNILMFMEERGTPREKRVFQREVHTTKNSD